MNTQHDPQPAEPAAPPCRHCGGSGSLRLDEQRWRTCLECLGHGRRLTLARPLLVPDLRTWRPSSSAAR